MSFMNDRTVARLREVAGGPVLAGERYMLEREIGRGGMGRVWLATDVVLGRDVALKVLDAEMDRPEIESRMRDEARILASLEHPGIVPVHDLGRTSDGLLFYVMKHVQGETLGTHLERVRDRADRLRIFERLCDPVAFAHARGVVHRDLKPDNVMVGSFGEVLVMDWGVAKVLAEPRSVEADAGENPPGGAGRGESAAEAARGRVPPDGMAAFVGPPRTDPGTVLGTPGFMAPEQARGEPVDARADVYALGSILLRMLDVEPPAGTPPHIAVSAARGVPRSLKAICAKALAPDPANRYRDVLALADDVARYRNGHPVAAYRENWLERTARWVRRYQVPVLLVVAYLVMRAIVALWIRQRPAP